MAIFAADASVQIAYVALIGTLAVPIITGIFGIVTAVLNKRTNADTSEKIERSARRVSAFEDMATRYQAAEIARAYFEERCDRQAISIVELRRQLAAARRQLAEAGITPTTETDTE